MTKNVLCIVDQYYPESSANTSCAESLMRFFQEEGCSVDYLSFRKNIDSKKIMKYKYGNILKFDTYQMRFLKKHKKFIKSQTWMRVPFLIRKTVSFFQKLKTKILYRDFPIELDSTCVSDAKKLIEKISKRYDIIISISSPFSLHMLATYLIKSHKNAKWYPVFLDPYVYNHCLPKMQINSRKKIAEKYLKNATKIFMQNGIFEENLFYNFNPNYHSKVIEISLPNLVNNAYDNKPQKSEKINLVYSGIFYKSIRNPEKMFLILDELGDKFKLLLMSKCCEDIVEDFLKKKKNIEVENIGYIVRSDALRITKGSNILVNLSNTITNQMPSKVFEYIGMGKPIINFYWNERDTSLYYLKKYQLAFNFNISSYTDKDIKDLQEFCFNVKDKFLTFEEATKNLQEERSEKVCAKVFQEVINE